MKSFTVVVFAVLVFMATLLPAAFAGEVGHYVPGSEGIKCGTLPPPGLYYRLYTSAYYADRVTNTGGHHLNMNYKAFIFSNVHRLIWVKDADILGADYFCDIVVPHVYTELEAKGLGADDHDFGFGDINIEPFGIAWHEERYDLAFGLSFYVPTGQYSKTNPASPGKDFWTQMTSFGGTYYFDAKKTLAASILCRYEIHSKKDHTDVKPGRDFLFEWSVSKELNKRWEAGLSGYATWQLSDDSGSDVTWDKSRHDRVYAIGPEISCFDPESKIHLTCRWLKEFGAVDRSEGDTITLVLTKMF